MWNKRHSSENLQALWDSLDNELEDESRKDRVLQRTMAAIQAVPDRVALRKTALRFAGIAAAIALPVFCALGSLNYVKKHSQPADFRLTEYFVPDGTVRNLVLEDGSEVSLNSGSVFICPASFPGPERRVFLSGEASFTVSANQQKPFIVSTSDFDVEVLGTVFDVNSYPESGFSSVVLCEGSVRIVHDGAETILNPNQQASFSRVDGRMTVSTVDAAQSMNWRQGGFAFERAGINELMTGIRRLYAVEVSCPDTDSFEQARITWKNEGRIPLESFLDILKSLIPGLNYRISEKHVYLYCYDL